VRDGFLLWSAGQGALDSGFCRFGEGGGCVRADARCSVEIFRRPRECACNQHEVMYVAFIQTLDVWMNYLKKE